MWRSCLPIPQTARRWRPNVHHLSGAGPLKFDALGDMPVISSLGKGVNYWVLTYLMVLSLAVIMLLTKL